MSRSIEALPPRTAVPGETVVDATGRQLRVGDRVQIMATVEALNPQGYGNNVVLRTEGDMPATAFYGPHKCQMHLHGQQVVLIEWALPKPQKTERTCQCPRDDTRMQTAVSRMLRSTVTCTACGLLLKTG